MSPEFNTFTQLFSNSRDSKDQSPLKQSSGADRKLLFHERFKGRISKMKDGEVPIFDQNPNTAPMRNFKIQSSEKIDDPCRTNSNIVSIAVSSMSESRRGIPVTSDPQSAYEERNKQDKGPNDGKSIFKSYNQSDDYDQNQVFLIKLKLNILLRPNANPRKSSTRGHRTDPLSALLKSSVGLQKSPQSSTLNQTLHFL